MHVNISAQKHYITCLMLFRTKCIKYYTVHVLCFVDQYNTNKYRHLIWLVWYFMLINLNTGQINRQIRSVGEYIGIGLCAGKTIYA
jgi:hypothetical protein